MFKTPSFETSCVTSISPLANVAATSSPEAFGRWLRNELLTLQDVQQFPEGQSQSQIQDTCAPETIALQAELDWCHEAVLSLESVLVSSLPPRRELRNEERSTQFLKSVTSECQSLQKKLQSAESEFRAAKTASMWEKMVTSQLEMHLRKTSQDIQAAFRHVSRRRIYRQNRLLDEIVECQEHDSKHVSEQILACKVFASAVCQRLILRAENHASVSTSNAICTLEPCDEFFALQAETKEAERECREARSSADRKTKAAFTIYQIAVANASRTLALQQKKEHMEQETQALEALRHTANERAEATEASQLVHLRCRAEQSVELLATGESALIQQVRTAQQEQKEAAEVARAQYKLHTQSKERMAHSAAELRAQLTDAESRLTCNSAKREAEIRVESLLRDREELRQRRQEESSFISALKLEHRECHEHERYLKQQADDLRTCLQQLHNETRDLRSSEKEQEESCQHREHALGELHHSVALLPRTSSKAFASPIPPARSLITAARSRSPSICSSSVNSSVMHASWQSSASLRASASLSEKAHYLNQQLKLEKNRYHHAKSEVEKLTAELLHFQQEAATEEFVSRSDTVQKDKWMYPQNKSANRMGREDSEPGRKYKHRDAAAKQADVCTDRGSAVTGKDLQRPASDSSHAKQLVLASEVPDLQASQSNLVQGPAQREEDPQKPLQTLASPEQRKVAGGVLADDAATVQFDPEFRTWQARAERRTAKRLQQLEQSLIADSSKIIGTQTNCSSDSLHSLSHDAQKSPTKSVEESNCTGDPLPRGSPDSLIHSGSESDHRRDRSPGSDSRRDPSPGRSDDGEAPRLSNRSHSVADMFDNLGNALPVSVAGDSLQLALRYQAQRVRDAVHRGKVRAMMKAQALSAARRSESS